jgi:hypothetical protein
MNSTLTTLPRKRKVHFMVRKFSYVEPPSHSEYIDPSQLHYSREEYSAIVLNINSTLQVMEGDENIMGENDLCCRGLESRTKRGWRQRVYNYKRALLVVINEQKRQRLESINDPDKISQIYRDRSNHCARNAVVFGMLDAKVANKIFQEEILEEENKEDVEIDGDSHKIGVKVIDRPFVLSF